MLADASCKVVLSSRDTTTRVLENRVCRSVDFFNKNRLYHYYYSLLSALLICVLLYCLILICGTTGDEPDRLLGMICIFARLLRDFEVSFIHSLSFVFATAYLNSYRQVSTNDIAVFCSISVWFFYYTFSLNLFANFQVDWTRVQCMYLHLT